MRKRFAIAFAGALALAFATVNTANAANWTGFYIGGSAGYMKGSGKATTPAVPFIGTLTSSANPSGFAGGVQIGYNWQNGPFVLGIEGDVNVANAEATRMTTKRVFGGFIPFTATLSHRIDGFATLRGRIGYAIGDWLPYATAGIVAARVETKCGGAIFGTPFATCNGGSRTDTGWAFGGGVDYAVNKNWSIRTEYLYMNLGSETINASVLGLANIQVTDKVKSHLFRLAFNYRF